MQLQVLNIAASPVHCARTRWPSLPNLRQLRLWLDCGTSGRTLFGAACSVLEVAPSLVHVELRARPPNSIKRLGSKQESRALDFLTALPALDYLCLPWLDLERRQAYPKLRCRKLCFENPRTFSMRDVVPVVDLMNAITVHTLELHLARCFVPLPAGLHTLTICAYQLFVFSAATFEKCAESLRVLDLSHCDVAAAAVAGLALCRNLEEIQLFLHCTHALPRFREERRSLLEKVLSLAPLLKLGLTSGCMCCDTSQVCEGLEASFRASRLLSIKLVCQSKTDVESDLERWACWLAAHRPPSFRTLRCVTQDFKTRTIDFPTVGAAET